MSLVDLIPDANVLLAMEPEELGLRMLPYLEVLQRSRMINLNLPAALDASAHYNARRSEVSIAIREAWAWLEGAGLLIEDFNFVSPNSFRMLSRKARQLALDGDVLRALGSRHLQREVLHPTIRDDVWSLFHRSRFDTAVFEAMKAVEVAVREAAGFDASALGTDLMRRAFHVEAGPLTDLGAERAERQARSDLFAGAIGSYKNPQSHRRVDLQDPDEAAEIILLANHLLRIVDARRQAES